MNSKCLWQLLMLAKRISIMNTPLKIMLVDDDPDILEQNKMMLEARGYQIVMADSSKEGWELFQRELPDACILDLMMEEFDSGFVLAHKIKRTEQGKKIPVFIVTAVTYATGFKFESDSEEEQEWIKTDAILNKPIQIEDVVERINRFYGEKK